jgi:two-component system, NtrC family, nitrogen regulation sensor histidine kinase NtrY
LLILNEKINGMDLSLAIRIQLVFIALVFVSLVAFGFGSGLFVKNQYQDYTTQLIREKMRSVEIEVMQKLGDEKNLSIVEHGNFMEYILKKFAMVFVTDINLYDKNGYMLSSSRPKVYNIGLVGEQINPKAWNELTVYKKSEYIHQENIGKLEYLSAYLPFYSHDGKLLAYLNLQHFGQQKGFEDQIQQFLVAIMNVFVLLLALSILSAIFISNWLTAPLRILQQNFAKIELGKYNKPISYSADDEIGALVKDYNQKLEELAFTAQQLAQSERESAWREMAKQVAHEIKNPLTPMKLGLQHLQRVFDPNDPQAAEKIARVSASMIEQIDALTNIANEFSNFAKMPVPKNEAIEISLLLENVITVFEKENDIQFEFINPHHEVRLLGDKDMLLRVFNNLIKNAIQAIPLDRAGKVRVSLGVSSDKRCEISIQDNGKGIPEEVQSKLFVPYFTTKSTGTGLGLAMVKQIVEMHHGKISYTSIENEGTTFVIELPLK